MQDRFYVFLTFLQFHNSFLHLRVFLTLVFFCSPFSVSFKDKHGLALNSRGISGLRVIYKSIGYKEAAFKSHPYKEVLRDDDANSYDLKHVLFESSLSFFK